MFNHSNSNLQLPPYLKKVRIIHFKIALAAIIFFMYEELPDYITWLAHLSFEGIEYTLETLLELFFETEGHQNEIIMSYFVLGAVLTGLYFVVLHLPRLYRKFIAHLQNSWTEKKAHFIQNWRAKTILEKFKFVAISITISSVWLFWQTL